MQSASLIDLLLASLSVFRITHLLVAEDGPWDLVARLRHVVARVAPRGLFDCFYCMSLWVSGPIALCLADSLRDGLLLWLSASAGAIVLERVSTRTTPEVVSVPYFEEENEHARLLRTEDQHGRERAQ